MIHAESIDLENVNLRDRLIAEEVAGWIVNNDDDDKVVGGAEPSRTLFLVIYHLLNDTLVVHRNCDSEIDGILMWNRFKGPVAIEDVMHWRPDDLFGDTILVGWMLSLCPQATTSMIREGLGKTDWWQECNFKAIRNGRIVNYPKNIVSRMLRK